MLAERRTEWSWSSRLKGWKKNWGLKVIGVLDRCWEECLLACRLIGKRKGLREQQVRWTCFEFLNEEWVSPKGLPFISMKRSAALHRTHLTYEP